MVKNQKCENGQNKTKNVKTEKSQKIVNRQNAKM